MPVLEFTQFSCTREEHLLFEPLSFQVPSGGIFQIAGPNGAGKTTFLRAVSGLYDHYQGHLQWGGEPIKNRAYERQCELLYLGHHPGVKGTLTARENLEWYLGLHGGEVASVESALAEVGLYGYEDTPCHHMSAGQQRRVALARLYITNTSVWVLDEPFTAIDVQGVKKLEALLVAHAEKGGSVLITSHQAITCKNLQVVELSPFKEKALKDTAP